MQVNLLDENSKIALFTKSMKLISVGYSQEYIHQRKEAEKEERHNQRRFFEGGLLSTRQKQ